MKNQLKFSLVAAVAITTLTTNLYATNIGGSLLPSQVHSGGYDYVGTGRENQTVHYDEHNNQGAAIGGASTDAVGMGVGNVTGNTLTISGSANNNLKGAYGGFIYTVSTNQSGLVVSNNTVNLDFQNTLMGAVYGGYSNVVYASTPYTITDNRVNFYQGIVNREVAGGGSSYGADNITNNVLNIGTDTRPINLSQTRQAQTIKNFSIINFYLPNTVSSSSPAALRLTNGADLSSVSSINTYISANPTSLSTGQNTITLISATGGSITGWTQGQGITQTATLRIGSVLQTTPNISVSGSNLNLSFDFTPGGGGGGGGGSSTVVVVNDAAKSISETRITQSQMVNLATDFVVDKVQNSLKPVDELQSFGYVGGAILKYNSGSHIDANGVNVNVGLGKNYDDFSFGGFLEYGFSTYESTVGNVEADGQSHLYGLGLFAKQMFSNKFYLASSLHGGLVESDYSRKDMDSTYDTRSPYVGFDFGMGKLVTLGKNQNIDLYAKYLFGFVASDDVTLSTGEEYKFEAVKSHRAKAGLKFNQTIRNFNFIYAGLGTQYEFSNESRASFRSGPLSEEAPRPSLKGVSGIGEVGYRFRPTEELSFEIGGKYYIGKMQGLSGNAGFQYRF